MVSKKKKKTSSPLPGPPQNYIFASEGRGRVSSVANFFFFTQTPNYETSRVSFRRETFAKWCDKDQISD